MLHFKQYVDSRTMFKKYLRYFSNQTKISQRITAVLVIIIVAAIGTYLLKGSKAASPYASTNAASGSLGGNAQQVQNCSGANNGSCVVFDATASTTKPTVVGHELDLGATGTRLKMRGVAVLGIGGVIGTHEYNNRQTVVNTIKAWGGNEIRLRVIACDYNSQKYMTQPQELQQIQDWQTTAQAAGLYLSVAWWDSSACGSQSGAAWATAYPEAFPMMTAVINKLGPNNPWVFYEPFNEPNNISESEWLAAMQATEQLYRDNGYTGILVLDTNNYSNIYNDTDMTTLETNDASLTGMNGKNQIIFAKHDYATKYTNNPAVGFTPSQWPNNNGATSTWDFSKHLVWETEFGNYNIVNSQAFTSYPWSQGAAAWMAAKVNDGTLVGATAFVFTWTDPNSMTTGDDITPTQWGGYVENDFLGAVN
jgi:hypothetical protein